ncbi:Lipoprotein, MlaA-like [Desulfonema limicola]|uniref:Lipoprotein, MlaA-like n=1 Tax=Desulfonema limicola TaxID=45656 RepID=A0A975B845_9BACT|nr:VacJ family lipoprotein [Desulfonema limicola]QTA80719.1 Lipoprotein, MlaA-like [Desulfonema limicola]
MNKQIYLILVLILSIFFSGCAVHKKIEKSGKNLDTPRDHLGFLDVYDPLESLNRRVYRFNTIVDNNLIEPVIRVYKKIIPLFVRDRITNFFSNIDDVLVMGNCLLQAKTEKTGEVAARIMVNSIFGIAGLWDPATNFGLIKYREDFGQTLGFYGVRPGPYIMLPILGPSTLRDSGGKLIDSLSKMYFVNLSNINTSTDLSLSTADSLEFRASFPFSYGDFDSPFEYDIVRVLYMDMRNLMINDGLYLEENKKVNNTEK